MPQDTPAIATTSFATFSFDPRLLAALEKLGYTEPTPIQSEAMPHVLQGRDLVGRARTGSGKTAAFGLPLLQRVIEGGKKVRAIVLTPTRELALQVTQALSGYAANLKQVTLLPIYGGAPYDPQLRALRAGVTIVVGTPGRVLDHLERGTLDLSHVEMFVLDEADEMLRMGFIDDVEKLLASTPSERQVVLFSATMPPPIRKIAAKHLKDVVEIQVERSGLSADHIEQKWMLVSHREKADALARVLLAEPPGAKLIFTRTRAACGQVADALTSRGVAADAIHGDLSQAARERVLRQLRTERLEVLVATDVAARGIDVEHLTHVINYDLPGSTETYVHRVGRTGRAGRKGRAISLVMPSEVRKWHQLERDLKKTVEEIPVPSNTDIAKQQRARLQHMVEASFQEPELVEQARTWTTELLEGQDYTMTDLAAAAICALARQHEIDLSPIKEETRNWRPSRRPDGGKRGDSRDRTGSDDRSDRRVPRSQEQHVELFLPIGSSEGLRPADVVGALANELGISGQDVGKITLGERSCFVGVSHEVAELASAHNKPIFLRGRDVELRLAHARDASERASGGGPNRGPSRGPSRGQTRDGGGSRGPGRRDGNARGAGRDYGRADGRPERGSVRGPFGPARERGPRPPSERGPRPTGEQRGPYSIGERGPRPPRGDGDFTRSPYRDRGGPNRGPRATGGAGARQATSGETRPERGASRPKGGSAGDFGPRKFEPRSRANPTGPARSSGPSGRPRRSANDGDKPVKRTFGKANEPRSRRVVVGAAGGASRPSKGRPTVVAMGGSERPKRADKKRTKRDS